MKKTVVKYLYIFAFIIVLGMPWLFWIIMGTQVDSENYENRSKAEMPMLDINNLQQYPVEFENYFNDNLPFRNQLITLNSKINYYIFHKSSNESVILGKDGWLFYNDVEDGDPMADYLGENLFTEKQLQQIAENMVAAEEYLADKGCEFVLFIAPNKSRVYSEMMPDYYGEPSEEYAVLQIVEYLKENTDIRVVYPYEDLWEAGKQLEDVILYHKVDTHWNKAGGYVGSVALLRELGITIPNIWDEEIEITETDNLSGDLANNISLQKDLIDNEEDYSIEGYGEHDFVTESSEFNGALSYRCVDAEPRKLFVYRDSFCTAMAGVLASQFNESYMMHYKNFHNFQLEEQKPDIFVLEIVERNVERLLKFDIEKE